MYSLRGYDAKSEYKESKDDTDIFWKQGISLELPSGTGYFRPIKFRVVPNTLKGITLGRILSIIHEFYHQDISQEERKAFIAHIMNISEISTEYKDRVIQRSDLKRYDLFPRGTTILDSGQHGPTEHAFYISIY